MITTQESMEPMMRGQRTLFTCPKCNAKNAVFVSTNQICSACKKSIPNVFKLINDVEYRKDHYMGIVAILSVVR